VFELPLNVVVVPGPAVKDPVAVKLPAIVRLLDVETDAPLAISKLFNRIPLPLIVLDVPVIEIVPAFSVNVPEPVVEMFPPTVTVVDVGMVNPAPLTVRLLSMVTEVEGLNDTPDPLTVKLLK
jgi:hypothetical protein